MFMEEKKTPETSANEEVKEIFSKKTEDKAETREPAKKQKQANLKEPVKNAKKQEGGKLISFILDIALNLLIVFGLVYVIQTFIASPFKVYGPSMCDTLNYIEGECHRGYGEYIIVNKLIYKDFFGFSLSKPERGDIIVFHPPHSDEQFYIKRIIGIPGDTVKLIEGDVFIFNDDFPTGYDLPEPYLNANNVDETLPSTNRVTTFNVPQGAYFVLGDNRKQSTDSRSCFRDAFQGGCRGNNQYFLPRENIEGKAWVVLWPLNKIRVIEEVDYY